MRVATCMAIALTHDRANMCRSGFLPRPSAGCCDPRASRSAASTAITFCATTLGGEHRGMRVVCTRHFLVLFDLRARRAAPSPTLAPTTIAQVATQRACATSLHNVSAHICRYRKTWAESGLTAAIGPNLVRKLGPSSAKLGTNLTKAGPRGPWRLNGGQSSMGHIRGDFGPIWVVSPEQAKVGRARPDQDRA